jgi:Domain of unknown function (DUF5668)
MSATVRRSSNQAVVGVVMIVIGVLFMLDNFDILRVGAVWQFWPVILIAMGIGKTLDRRPSRRHSGAWLVMVGTWLQLNVLGILDWGESWPLLIVAVGISMVLRAIDGEDRPEIAATDQHPEAPRE